MGWGRQYVSVVTLGRGLASREGPVPVWAIVMHLLEKDPDNRYQTAEGLIYDLERLDHPGVQAVGGHDFPVGLLRPSRMVGRYQRWTELDR